MNYDILYDGSTDLESYQVIDSIYGGRKARVLYDRDRRAAQSGKPLDDNSDMLFDYNERFMELVRGLLPHKVLVLGGGAFTLPQAILDELPDIHIDIVELDSGLVDIAEGFFDFKPTDATNVYITDARTYIDNASEKYDLIIVDVYMETTIPLNLQTAEATASIVRALAPSGTVAMNIISAYYGQRAAVLQRQVATWQPVFKQLQLFPAGKGYSLWLPQNFVLIGQQSDADVTPFLRHSPIELPAFNSIDLQRD